MRSGLRLPPGWLARLAACLWLLMGGGGILAATLEIDPHAEQMDISGHIALLHDPSGRLHFTEVAAMESEFRLVQRGNLAQSFNAGVFWLRISLAHAGSQPITRWLAVGTPKIKLITLYLHGPAGWQVMNAGKGVPRALKPVIATDPVFPLTLPPGESRDILVRVEARGATDMTSILWEPHAYRLASGDRKLVLAGIIGGLLISSLLSLVVFVRLRETSYLWLGLMLVSLAGLESTRENLLGVYLWPAHLGFPSQVLSLFAGLALFALSKVVAAALESRRHIPLGDRLLLVMRWLGVLGTAVSLPAYGMGVAILSTVAAVMLPASLGLSVLAWRRGYAPARIFTLAFATAILIETARQLANLGWLPWAAAMNFSIAGFLLSTPFILWGMVEKTRQLTEQLAVAEQLKDAKSAFLARVSHELRSPLNTILGFTRMLRRGSARLSLQEGTVGIEKSALRLLVLIDELLDESRAAAGKLTVSPAPVRFADWLDELCHNAEIFCEGQGNRFICERAGPLPEAIAVDGMRLRQVLDNFLSNANRHTHQGEIRLECQARIEGDTAMLDFAVQDNGEGMSPEHLKMIFEPFVRGRESAAGDRRRRSGFGLGLSISRELVRQMGGEIVVTSRLAHGSRFRFSIHCPLARAADLPEPGASRPSPGHPRQEPPAAADPVPSARSANAPQVLLVDDDPQQLRVLSDLLDESGFVVHQAHSGQAAASLLQDMSVDAVITDQMMADGDGWFLLRRIRESGRPAAVMLLSAALAQAPAGFPETLAFDAVLRKPALSDALLDALWLMLLNVGAGGTAISPRDLETLASLAGDGDVSGIEDWIAGLGTSGVSAAPAVRWIGGLLHRLDLALIERLARKSLDGAPTPDRLPGPSNQARSLASASQDSGTEAIPRRIVS